MPTIFIVIPATAIVIIIFWVIYRKQIKLKLLHIVLGKYSFEYVTQFKKYTNKSPFPYCFKDDILPYLWVSNKKKEEIKIFTSEKSCSFENLSFGAFKNKVLSGKSNPDCFNVFRLKNSELRSYGYYKNQYGIEVKAVFFFFEDVFFMGEYIFDNSRKIDKSYFFKDLISQNDLDQLENLSQFFVSCKNNTSVFYYDNGFTVTVRYSDLSNDKLSEILT